MENVNTETHGHVAHHQPKRWFHNGWFSRGFLIVAAMFFFLPFIDIKCSGTKLASIKGSDLIFGSELKMNDDKSNEQAADSTETSDEETQVSPSMGFSGDAFGQADYKNIAPNVLAISAFAAIILALLFTFFTKRLPIIVSGGLALLAVVGLFFFQIHLQNEVQTKMGPFTFVPITFEFTPFYWCSLVFLVLASIFSFVRSSGARA